MLDDCHLEAHALAYAARSALGVERAFLLSSDQCRMGYVHGAPEAAGWGSRDRPGTAHAVAARSCSRFRTPDVVAACSHGFGHAVMRASANDVRRATRGCARAEGRGIYVAACEAGVMMQNSLAHAHLPEQRFLRAAARGCEAVAQRRLRRSCYDHLGVVAALSFRHDRRRSAALCRRLRDRLARAACLDGTRDEIAESRQAGEG